MKRRVITFLCMGAVSAFIPTVRARVTDTSLPAPAQAEAPESSGDQQPYSAIWTRNVFDLKPPEDKTATKTPDVAPPSNVKLIGIYTLFGKRALVSVQDQAGPGKPAGKEEFFNLSEGERHGSLEVLEINPAERTIKVKNEDIVSLLRFETNKAPAPAMASTPHPPGVNGFTPPPPQLSQPMNGNSMQLPSRSLRSSPNLFNNNQPTPSAAGFSSGYQPTANGGLNSLFAPATAPQSPVGPSGPGLSAEEAMTQFYLQQAAHQGDPNFPPPLPLPPGLSGENNTPNTPQNPNSTAPYVPPQLRGRVSGSIPLPPSPP